MVWGGGEGVEWGDGERGHDLDVAGGDVDDLHDEGRGE